MTGLEVARGQPRVRRGHRPGRGAARRLARPSRPASWSRWPGRPAPARPRSATWRPGFEPPERGTVTRRRAARGRDRRLGGRRRRTPAARPARRAHRRGQRLPAGAPGRDRPDRGVRRGWSRRSTWARSPGAGSPRRRWGSSSGPPSRGRWCWRPGSPCWTSRPATRTTTTSPRSWPRWRPPRAPARRCSWPPTTSGSGRSPTAVRSTRAGSTDGERVDGVTFDQSGREFHAGRVARATQSDARRFGNPESVLASVVDGCINAHRPRDAESCPSAAVD